MKLRHLFILAALFLFGPLTSCDDDDDPSIEYSATYPISGDWTVTYSADDGTGNFLPLVEDAELLIYNTSANIPTEVWVDDHGGFQNFKVRANVDLPNLAFSGDNLQNTATGSKVTTVTISNGKIIRDGALQNGIKRDSIYFEVSLGDATIYRVAGHRSTGFE